MREDTLGEVHAFEGQWITFAEAAQAAYLKRNRMGLNWKITHVSEVSMSEGVLTKLASYLRTAHPTDVSNVLNSLPSEDRSSVMDLMTVDKNRKGATNGY